MEVDPNMLDLDFHFMCERRAAFDRHKPYGIQTSRLCALQCKRTCWDVPRRLILRCFPRAQLADSADQDVEALQPGRLHGAARDVRGSLAGDDGQPRGALGLLPGLTPGESDLVLIARERSGERAVTVVSGQSGRPVAGSSTSNRLAPGTHWPLTKALVFSRVGSLR